MCTGDSSSSKQITFDNYTTLESSAASRNLRQDGYSFTPVADGTAASGCASPDWTPVSPCDSYPSCVHLGGLASVYASSEQPFTSICVAKQPSTQLSFDDAQSQAVHKLVYTYCAPDHSETVNDMGNLHATLRTLCRSEVPEQGLRQVSSLIYLWSHEHMGSVAHISHSVKEREDTSSVAGDMKMGKN